MKWVVSFSILRPFGPSRALISTQAPQGALPGTSFVVRAPTGALIAATFPPGIGPGIASVSEIPRVDGVAGDAVAATLTARSRRLQHLRPRPRRVGSHRHLGRLDGSAAAPLSGSGCSDNRCRRGRASAGPRRARPGLGRLVSQDSGIVRTLAPALAPRAVLAPRKNWILVLPLPKERCGAVRRRL